MVMCGLYMDLRFGVQRYLRAGGKLVFPYRYHLLDFLVTLGQFTRNYTQTTKRGLLTTNKG